MKYSEAVVWSNSPKIKREVNRQRRPRQRRRMTGTARKQMIKELNMPQFEVWCRLLVGCICLVCSCIARAVSEPRAHRVARSQSVRCSKERNQWTWVRMVKHKGMRDGRRASGCYLITSRSRHRVLVRSLAFFSSSSTFASSSSFFSV